MNNNQQQLYMTLEQLKYVNSLIDILPEESPEIQSETEEIQSEKSLEELLEELVPSETLPETLPESQYIDLLVTDVPENASNVECCQRYLKWIRICHRKHKSNSIKRKRDEERIKKGFIPYHLKLFQRIGKNKKRCKPHLKIKLCSAYKERQDKLKKQKELRKAKKKQPSV